MNFKKIFYLLLFDHYSITKLFVNQKDQMCPSSPRNLTLSMNLLLEVLIQDLVVFVSVIESDKGLVCL